MSGDIWIIGESDEGQLGQSTPGVATLACALAEQAGLRAAGVLVGTGIAEASRAFAAHVPKVLSCELAQPADWDDPADVASVIAALVVQRAPSYLLIPGSSIGRALAGMLAARLGWGVITGAQAVTWVDGPEVVRVVFRSETRIDSRLGTDHGIITVQPNINPAVARLVPGHVEHLNVPAGFTRSPIRRVERTRTMTVARASPRLSLEAARVVVAGGAGVGSAEAWLLVERLAVALEGAVGASRPPVDNGWVPLSVQIGQTGKTVRPDLYLALGISGEILHRVGMRAARAVIAVNLDSDVPFRDHADLLVVADLLEFVPALLAEIERRTSALETSS